MRLITAAVIVLQLAACDYGARRQLSNLREENQTLEAQLKLSSVYIQDVTDIMDEVQQNLNAIEEREGVIGRISLESGRSDASRRGRAVNVRRELLTSISDIDAFIQENREKMDALKQRIATSSVRIESLERLVDNLRVTVEEKEKNVSQLKAQVRVLEGNIASLQGELRQREVALQEKDSTIAQQLAAISEKDETIQIQVEEAATGYYVIDSRDALRRKGLITERRSGFLGLGKTTSVGFIREEHFVGVSKQQAAISFDGPVRDIEIVSAHRDRPDLFAFDRSRSGSQLVINDPEGFWAISDYLIIISDD